MKSSLEKLGRRLTMHKTHLNHQMTDHHHHQPCALLDDLLQASKDMQEMRNCYDGLLSAAAATANSIYEYSESLNEMGNCLLGKTAVDADFESGKVLSTLGTMQLELQKIADTYRSYVIVTITNPAESLLSELKKVEEMKLQCDEKREVYEYMMAQHKEKGKLRNSSAQKLREAQDEYDEVTRLCVFRVKSLKEGQWRSLLTQAARHHAAQMNFFRKGLKAVEAVEPLIRNITEKHRIDCQLSELYELGTREGDPMGGYDSPDNGELSFDYKQKKQGLGDDDDGTTPNPMELNHIDVPYFEDSEPNVNRQKEDQLRQRRVSSYSAPLYPDKFTTSVKLKETQPTRKFYSYVLPQPVTDTRNPVSKPATPVSHSTSFQSLQNDNSHITSTSALTSKVQSTTKDGNNIRSSTQLPVPTGRFSFSQQDNYSYNKIDGGKTAKRQSFSGPLPPSKQFSFKFTSNNSGPIPRTELPQPPSRATFSQPNLARSVSPPPLSSPKISELHELPRPPSSSNLAVSQPVGGLIGHTAPLVLKSQEISPPNKQVMLTSTLPLPPAVVKMKSSKGET